MHFPIGTSKRYFHTCFICSKFREFGDGYYSVVRVVVVNFKVDGDFLDKSRVNDLEVVPTSKCCRLCLARQQ